MLFPIHVALVTLLDCQDDEFSAKITETESTVVVKEAMGDKLGNLVMSSSMFVSSFAVGFYCLCQILC